MREPSVSGARMSIAVADTASPKRGSFDISNGTWFQRLKIVHQDEEKIDGFDIMMWQHNDGHGLEDKESVQQLANVLERSLNNPVAGHPSDVLMMGRYFVEWLRECQGGFAIY